MKKEIVIDGNLYRLVEETEVENPVPSYKEVCNVLMRHDFFFINDNGVVREGDISNDDPNNSPSKTQLEALLAINKLANVARFVNGDWECLYMKEYYSIYNNCGRIDIKESVSLNIFNFAEVIFKSREAAERAVEILGEEEVKKCFRLQE